MEQQSQQQGIPISMMQGAIFASLQGVLMRHLMLKLRNDLLEMARKHRCSRALLDMSGIETIDKSEFDGIVDTAKMLKLMGVKTWLVGMRPGIISGLSAVGADITAVQGVCNLKQALEH
ncbi:STAS domain-containing protein [Undibacterium sp. SXout20W]|uniref:STAS domain-containing protein n=1 Tax=Undibacterium sp. SXout20W TaxID=3413051 RepID=UPI003BF3F068